MKLLTACARLLAGFFAILFIISALISILLFNAQRHFTNPERYKQILLEARLYDSLPRLLSKQISAGMNYDPCAEDPNACEDEPADDSEEDEGGPPDYFRNMNSEQWEMLLGDILTSDWVQTQTERIIDQLFTFLDSDEDTPEISISLVDLKSRLMSREGTNIILEIIENQPPCTNEQQREIKISIVTNNTSGDILSCHPPQDLLEEYMSSIDETLNEAIRDLPDEAILGQSFMGSDMNEATESSGDDISIGKTIRRIRTYMRLSPFIPAVFLLLIAVFGVRSFRDLLRWWGIPILITGILTLAFSILAMPIFNWILRTYVEVKIPGYFSSELVKLVFEISRSAIRGYVTIIAIQGGVIALIGILTTMISTLSKPRPGDVLQ